MKLRFVSALILSLLFTSCGAKGQVESVEFDPKDTLSERQEVEKDFYRKLADAAVGIIDRTIVYDPAYRKISYPNGDVDPTTGVCTDVVIRAYRKMGIDLQKEMHEDIKANFSLYPNQKRWGLTSPDRNIDHRRVPNQQVFFARKGQELPVSEDKDDYSPGDIVTWDLGRGITHVGIVVDHISRAGNPLIVHNIGGGQVMQDVLFRYTITGHYRYEKKEK